MESSFHIDFPPPSPSPLPAFWSGLACEVCGKKEGVEEIDAADVDHGGERGKGHSSARARDREHLPRMNDRNAAINQFINGGDVGGGRSHARVARERLPLRLRGRGRVIAAVATLMESAAAPSE